MKLIAEKGRFEVVATFTGLGISGEGSWNISFTDGNVSFGAEDETTAKITEIMNGFRENGYELRSDLT